MMKDLPICRATEKLFIAHKISKLYYQYPSEAFCASLGDI